MRPVLGRCDGVILADRRLSGSLQQRRMHDVSSDLWLWITLCQRGIPLFQLVVGCSVLCPGALTCPQKQTANIRRSRCAVPCDVGVVPRPPCPHPPDCPPAHLHLPYVVRRLCCVLCLLVFFKFLNYLINNTQQRLRQRQRSNGRNRSSSIATFTGRAPPRKPSRAFSSGGSRAASVAAAPTSPTASTTCRSPASRLLPVPRTAPPAARVLPQLRLPRQQQQRRKQTNIVIRRGEKERPRWRARGRSGNRQTPTPTSTERGRRRS